MNPRTFHLTTAAALTAAALIYPLTPPSPTASAATPAAATRPAMTVKQTVISAALVAGYSKRDLRCALRLIERENRAFNPRAVNRQGSTASGLWQHLKSPSGVMLKDLSVPAQNQRGLRYLRARYGTATDPHGACTALAFHKRNGHY